MKLMAILAVLLAAGCASTGETLRQPVGPD